MLQHFDSAAWEHYFLPTLHKPCTIVYTNEHVFALLSRLRENHFQELFGIVHDLGFYLDRKSVV